MNEKIVMELKNLIPIERVLDDDSVLTNYSEDMTEIEPSKPELVVKVQCVEEVQKVVKFANENKIPLIPAVARTNLGGLTIPEKGGIIVDLTEMNKIIEVNETEMYAIIEPGVTFEDMKNYLEKNYPHLRFSYPLSPPYVSVVANFILDGLVNLSLKHGSCSSMINGLEAVLGNGDLIKTGSCALSPIWFSRAPLPDLTGLFINMQGTTGIVTKLAVQLWPNPPYRKRCFYFGYSSKTFALIRKLCRLQILDDLGNLTWPTGKMLLGIERPIEKDPDEPEFILYVDFSGNNLKELKVKEKLINDTIKEANSQGIEIDGNIEVETLRKVNPRLTKLSEFPTYLDFLMDHSGKGLTWIGTYGPTASLEEGVEKGGKIMKENGFPPVIVTRPMKGGHFAVLRYILLFNKKDKKEVELVKNVNELLCDLALELGYVPYKTPVWIVKKIIDKMDKNFVILLKEVKKIMDPNQIMNPGKWLL